MFRGSNFTVCLVALFFAGSNVKAQTPPVKDFQQWTQVAVAYQVKSKLELTGFGEVRIGKDLSKFDGELLSAGLAYSVSRWISVGTGYLYLHANPKLSGLKHENRIYGEVTFQAPAFHHLLLSDRVRSELRWLDLPAEARFTQRYRNRVTVSRPVAIHKKTYVPFVMWEKFYDASLRTWSKTRYYAGVTVPVAEKESIQFYFMHQDDKYSRPFNKNVIGASLLVHFGGAHPEHPHE